MDLDEEQEENEYLFYGTKHHVTPNESKLQLSEQYVYSKYAMKNMTALRSDQNNTTI